MSDEIVSLVAAAIMAMLLTSSKFLFLTTLAFMITSSTALSRFVLFGHKIERSYGIVMGEVIGYEFYKHRENLPRVTLSLIATLLRHRSDHLFQPSSARGCQDLATPYCSPSTVWA